MFNGPFRPYEDPSTQQCLQDIMDGYFPSELQMRYPDGIPLQVKQCRTCAGLPSRLLRPKVSMEQLLNELSKPLRHRGEAIGSATSTALAPQLMRSLTSRVKAAEEAEAPAPDVCTLRIKSESGEQMYMVKMLFTETIGDLRQHLTHARGGDSDSYEIISTFPQRVYTDNSQSLQECGLTPNACLLLQRRDPSLAGPGSQPHGAASLAPSLPAAGTGWMLQQDTVSLEKSIIPLLLPC
uniref:UBX domain-containing protein 11 n=1 Tax=Amazona collaria TaxID=241587 RepID=A0A8B9IRJ3_9PSIT